MLDCPSGPLLEDLLLLITGQLEVLPTRSHTGGNIPEKGLYERPDASRDVVAAQT